MPWLETNIRLTYCWIPLDKVIDVVMRAQAHNPMIAVCITKLTTSLLTPVDTRWYLPRFEIADAILMQSANNETEQYIQKKKEKN